MFSRKYGHKPFEMPPVSWSNERYYLEQVCILACQFILGEEYIAYEVNNFL